MNKFFKFLALSTLFFPAPAFAESTCQNFTGIWEGTCKLENGHESRTITKVIKQNGCTEIQVDGQKFGFGAPTVTKKEVGTDPDGTVTTKTNTSTYHWDNQEQTRIMNISVSNTSTANSSIKVYSYETLRVSGDQLLT